MGNFESKLSPYYSVSEESLIPQNNPNLGNNSNIENKGSFASDNANLRLWTVKRANFNNECKNATLFELNKQYLQFDSKKTNICKHLTFALNQIKTLKTLRHPNIVKYFYSEEPLLNGNFTNSKCLLITESIRPLSTLINDLSNHQIIAGIYGLTNALIFLHEKVLLSHNNINESCIYLNSKQAWKLNDFELALSFSNLNKENLRNIYEFKHKTAITPEEEQEMNENLALNKIDLDMVFKECPHALDAYAWAITLLILLPNKNQTNKGLFNNVFTELNQDVDEDTDESLAQLEFYLNKNPMMRPKIKHALDMKLFNSTKTVENSFKKNFSIEFSSGKNEVETITNNSSSDKSYMDLFCISNLEELDANFSKLIEYLQTNQNSQILQDEKLIDFLLSPFMFFSLKFRKHILPGILVPKELNANSSNKINYFACYLSSKSNLAFEQDSEASDMFRLEPFIDLDKYKAFVIPRILNLFPMHSAQIRISLLEYFSFYIRLVKDKDTLKYEILPELLIGLKDMNDELVSLTFLCLSTMVELLGSETVVGKSSFNKRHKIFSEKIPKINTTELDNNKQVSIELNKTNGRIFYNKNKSTEMQNDSNKNRSNSHLNLSLNEKNSSFKQNYATSLDEDAAIINKDIGKFIEKMPEKLFSDSMIGLHDESETLNRSVMNNLFKNDFESIERQKNEIEDDLPIDDEWSNDFGWNCNSNFDLINERFDLKPESSASLVSLAGSDTNQRDKTSNLNSKGSMEKLSPNVSYKASYDQNEIVSEFDIKSLKIIKIKSIEDPKENLIENFLNEMQPVINKKKTLDDFNYLNKNKEDNISSEKFSIDSNKFKIELKNNDSNQNSWECDEIIDLDDV